MLLQCANSDFCLYIVNSCDFTVHALKKKKMLNTNVQNMQSKWVHSVGLGLDLDLASTFSFQRFPLLLFFIHAFQGDKFTVHAL